MTPYKNILFCADDSDDAQAAWTRAVDIARRDGARLHILHVLRTNLRYSPTETTETAPPGEVVYTSPEVIAKVESGLRAKYQVNLGRVEVAAWVVKPGTAFVEILRYARQNAIDLIAMGSVGLSGRQPTHYDSTLEKVRRWARCQVMAMRSAGDTQCSLG